MQVSPPKQKKIQSVTSIITAALMFVDRFFLRWYGLAGEVKRRPSLTKRDSVGSESSEVNTKDTIPYPYTRSIRIHIVQCLYINIFSIHKRSNVPTLFFLKNYRRI